MRRTTGSERYSLAIENISALPGVLKLVMFNNALLARAGHNISSRFHCTAYPKLCASCNRVRITAKGAPYPCLRQNDVLPLISALRAPENSSDDGALRAAISHTMEIKPLQHDLTHHLDTPKVVRFISMTGG